MSTSPHLYDLSGRVVLVTGAGSSIGRATALAFAAAGASVACADKDEPSARRTASLIAALGGTARSLALDVTDRAAVAAAVDGTVSAYGRLDVLAALDEVDHAAPILETCDADVERLLDVNFKGVLHCAREAARPMVEQKSGCIVTTASDTTDADTEDLTYYGASKAAVAPLVRALAAELGPHGIRANAVVPSRRSDTEGAPPRGENSLPYDVAGTVLFLASEASAFMNGQVLRANGKSGLW
ncbi:SDR family oxidoreductase [Streptomyces sp. SID13726]|uniref:SDR family NAD(P)-dependent oxidoreductase n=1 Tax=Streptomyces sp. SID13726 TaxID=2706058 RepID=UPI0013BB2C79|nr:SDR family oxidoreductase [Streptomyces sp. SID13726]NEA98930.1 SDR family oxidoreductase [Streptomyces sp. SID13726]